MKIKYYCPVWGMKHLPLPLVLEKIKTAGYDGAEIALNPDVQDIAGIKRLFDEHGLELLIQHPYAKGNTPAEMLADFVSKLDMLLNLNPVMVNCHTGKDYFSIADNLEFIKSADKLAKEYNISVAHETHRGRFSFSSTVIEQYINAFADLKLTADFSHWCVVAESLLENQQEIIEKVIPHCVYIHARVGYAQGPQVPDPWAPGYIKELQQHIKWWQRVLDYHRQTQKQELSIACEYGPPPYMHTIPLSSRPVEEAQFEVNLLMKDYLSKNLK